MLQSNLNSQKKIIHSVYIWRNFTLKTKLEWTDLEAASMAIHTMVTVGQCHEKWIHLPDVGWTVGVDVGVGFRSAGTAWRLI